VLGLLAIVVFLPNSQQIGERLDAAVARGSLAWFKYPEAVRVVFASVIFWIAAMSIVQQSRFLYYQY
jgi:hypothetical protein